ncbi:MAG: DUF3467 domain-containing protein [Rhodospirillales bacterium]
MRTADGPPIATYANFCEVGHNTYEFLIDFGQFQPATGEVRVHSRIVSGPVQAKLFARVLNDSLARYERDHGPIAVPGDDDALAALMSAMPDFESLARSARRERRRPNDPRTSER